MTELVPVDFDPFAASPPSSAGALKLVPVDHDPFKAAAPPNADAPGPWPGVTSPAINRQPEQRPSALAHVGDAVADAFKGPYGPGEELVNKLGGTSSLPILAASGPGFGDIAKYGGMALDAMGRPFQAAVRGGAAGASEIARALGADDTQVRKTERDLNLMGDVGLALGGTATPKLTRRGLTGPEASVPSPGPLSKIGRINPSDQAKQTIQAGFVLPPAEASVGHVGEANLANAAAGEAGKTKLAQLASAKNQPLVNVYAKADLGLPLEGDLTPNAFRDVRSREGAVYQDVVNAVPEVDLRANPNFVAAVKKVGDRSEETERLFPSTKEPPGIPALRDELLRNSRGSTQAVMDYIADLRKNATVNFQKEGDAMAHRMGAAQRQAAHALEDAMQHSVENAPQYYKDKLRVAERTRDAILRERPQQELPLSGAIVDAANKEVEFWANKLQAADTQNEMNQTLADRFRKARETMAKSYDVESVTNVSTGDVNARGLGRLLQRGKPLTGNLKLIADSANSFSRAFQDPAKFGGVESYSALDIGAAALAATNMMAHGRPGAAVGVMAAPLIRPLTRARVLSPGFQKRMISQPTPGTAARAIGPTTRAAMTASGIGATPTTDDTLNQIGGP